ncbi:MAG: hypothetical protein M0D53_16520 [Flavobacterium sp. JAD_PAG50586_2]|nr:MAG: hypothetical protein M0D53_16520 [Flavobacterium sp. JAD_PAG50586_2]
MTTVPKYFRFPKESTICILNYNSQIDESTVLSLRQTLKKVGFNTVSYPNATKAIYYKGKPSIKYKNDEIEEILSIKDFNSIYELRMTFKDDAIKGYPTEVKVNVVDMNTKQIVLYYTCGSEKSIKAVLNKFVLKLSEKISKY